MCQAEGWILIIVSQTYMICLQSLSFLVSVANISRNIMNIFLLPQNQDMDVQ